MSEITREELQEHVRRCDDRVAALCASRDATIKEGVISVGGWDVTGALEMARAARRDLALYDEMHALATTTPKRVRNEAARCLNCPYFDKEGFPTQASASGACRINEVALCQSKKSWCGQHPDFWKES